MITVNDIFDYMNQRFPFSSQEAWDNSGLLCGSGADDVKICVLSLDADSCAFRTARETGAQLLVTHHPIIFNPLSRVEADSPVWLAASSRVSVISCHTPLDKADGGTNDVLCGILGLENVERTDNAFLKTGYLKSPETMSAFARNVSRKLHTDVKYMFGDRTVSRIAVCTGAGGDFFEDAAKNGAELLLTGEAKYHESLAAREKGFPILEAGHFETEYPAMERLCEEMQREFPNVRFVLSEPEKLTQTILR